MADEIVTITLNSVELGYCVHGAGSDKPCIVFVHGGFMRSTEGLYKELLELLAQRYVVYALDLRGHGASANAVEEWSQGALADDVVVFSKALNLEAPIFVGHSFGAVIGLFAEIRHPGTFSALCLLSPGKADPRHDPVAALDFMIEHGHDREMLRGGFIQMFTRPPGVKLDRILDAVTLVDKGVFRALRDEHSRFSIDDQLKDVTAPVLIISGERDTVILPARQHDMARKLPFSKEVIFSAEGHMMANESASIAACEIITFLDADKVL